MVKKLKKLSKEVVTAGVVLPVGASVVAGAGGSAAPIATLSKGLGTATGLGVAAVQVDMLESLGKKKKRRK